MRLTQITLKNFTPFADGVVDFPIVEAPPGLAISFISDAVEGKLAEVHLFTGENGTGKTRVLAALMAALGNIQPLRDRVREKDPAQIEVRGDWQKFEVASEEVVEGSAIYTPRQKLRVWAYRNGFEDPRNPNFALDEDPPFALAGMGMALLAEEQENDEEDLVAIKLHERLNLSGSVGGKGLTKRLKRLRLEVAREREMSTPGQAGKYTKCLVALEDAITSITGQTFALTWQGGRKIRLMARWQGADLFFSELPDGLRSLLNWLAGWVVITNEHFEESPDPLAEKTILILDEPENHLHPAWQRRVLPAVQKLFPNAQMFVVTHSPFVVSSLNEGWIHKFTRGEDGLVRIEEPRKASRGDSYMTALQEILDLTQWFDPETEEELKEFDALLDQAYSANGSAEETMRKKASALCARSQEVTNLVVGLVSQFDRTQEVRKRQAAGIQP